MRSGVVWVLRNDFGKVLIYSRRVFSNIRSNDEVKFYGFRWAIESMHDYRFNRVIFVLDDDIFTMVILRFKVWLNFRC